MKKANLLLLVIILCFIFSLSSCKKEDNNEEKEEMNITYQTFTIMSGTVYETEGYIINSGITGPNVAILGGVHGNEHGGYLAAEELKNQMIAGTYYFKGVILIIPKANKHACKYDLRKPTTIQTNPSNSSDESCNLNRQFPGSATGTLTEQLAYQIVSKIEEFNPKCFLDLHESLYNHEVNKNYLGELVIGRNGNSQTASAIFLETFNNIYKGYNFEYDGTATVGSSTYYFSGAYLTNKENRTQEETKKKNNYVRNVIAYTVETTKGDDSISKEKHINMVKTILEYLWS